MASGRPIVATYESGATTLVKDGVEGFIVRVRDPMHIAEAMIRIATDAELNRRMGEAVYQKGAVRNTCRIMPTACWRNTSAAWKAGVFLK